MGRQHGGHRSGSPASHPHGGRCRKEVRAGGLGGWVGRRGTLKACWEGLPGTRHVPSIGCVPTGEAHVWTGAGLTFQALLRLKAPPSSFQARFPPSSLHSENLPTTSTWSVPCLNPAGGCVSIPPGPGQIPAVMSRPPAALPRGEVPLDFLPDIFTWVACCHPGMSQLGRQTVHEEP